MSSLPLMPLPAAKASEFDIDAMLAALDALDSGKQQQKSALFSKLYPSIVRALARRVPQKKILAELERLGLKLHPARFKEMLEAEVKALAERGDCVRCEHCGSVLPPPMMNTDETTARMSGSPDASGGGRSGSAK